MSQESRVNKEVLLMSIQVEMTTSNVSMMKEGILTLSSLAQEIEIDLSHVTRIDSAGLQLLMLAKLVAWENNRAVRFTGHSKAVTDAMAQADLSIFFGDPIFTSSSQHEGTDMNLDDVLHTFVFETRELPPHMKEALLNIERGDYDKDTLNAIFQLFMTFFATLMRALQMPCNRRELKTSLWYLPTHYLNTVRACGKRAC
jgi:anti-anti-sigma regulatory factor